MSSERVASQSKGARALRALILGRVHTLARPEQPPSRAEPVRRCGARRSYGRGLCRCSALYANGRCRMHGGPSRGPVTPEGRRAALEALAAVNARRRKTQVRKMTELTDTTTTPVDLPAAQRLRAVITGLERARREAEMAQLGARLDVLDRIAQPLRAIERNAVELAEALAGRRSAGSEP